MPTIVLAPALARWLPAGGGGELRFEIEATTLRDALDAAFAVHPALRGYVVDEQGQLRHHVAVFVDGQVLRDKSATTTTVLRAGSEIYLLQALSGG